MQGGGISNNDRIWALRQGLSQVCIGRICSDFLSRQCGFLAAQQQDILFAQLKQIAEVPPPNRTKTCDQKFDKSCLLYERDFLLTKRQFG